MGFFNRLRHIKGFWRYGNARGLMSKQRYGAAASVLKNVRLPNGHKQIAMIYLANCYSRINEKDEAIRAYSDVIESEESWGGRSNAESSTYIVCYAKFYRSVVLRSKYGSSSPDDVALYDKLLALKVPRSLTKYYLPLPLRSSLRKLET